MLEHLLSPANLPFAVALGLGFLLGVLEIASTLLGFAASQAIDGALPELSADAGVDADLDVDADTASPDALSHASPLAAALAWLHLGRVPTLLLLLLFLGAFGGLGLALQATVQELFGAPLHSALASVPALLLSLPVVRAGGGLIARLLPKEESSAVSRDSFIGRLAQVVTGTAQSGNPAQAKLKDEHGQTHYLMVEPEDPSQQLPQGSWVVLTEQRGALFSATPADLPELESGRNQA